MPAISKRLSTTLASNTKAPLLVCGLTAMAATHNNTRHCSATTIGTLGRPVAIRFQKKLERLPNIGAAEITAMTQGSASKVLAATTATNPPSIRLVASGSVNSHNCSRWKLFCTAGSRPGTLKRLSWRDMDGLTHPRAGRRTILRAALAFPVNPGQAASPDQQARATPQADLRIQRQSSSAVTGTTPSLLQTP